MTGGRAARSCWGRPGGRAGNATVLYFEAASADILCAIPPPDPRRSRPGAGRRLPDELAVLCPAAASGLFVLAAAMGDAGKVIGSESSGWPRIERLNRKPACAAVWASLSLQWARARTAQDQEGRTETRMGSYSPSPPCSDTWDSMVYTPGSGVCTCIMVVVSFQFRTG